MVKYCCSGKLIHQSHMNALETQNWSVCGLSLHLLPVGMANNTEMLLKYCKKQHQKNPPSTCLFHIYSGWFLCPFLQIPFYKSTSSSHPWNCNKVVFSVEQKSVDNRGSFPVCRAVRRLWGYRKLSSTRSEESIPMSSIMSMSSMVSSSLLMKVELLEPVSMALSSDVCELEETNISEIRYKAHGDWVNTPVSSRTECFLTHSAILGDYDHQLLRTWHILCIKSSEPPWNSKEHAVLTFFPARHLEK